MEEIGSEALNPLVGIAPIDAELRVISVAAPALRLKSEVDELVLSTQMRLQDAKVESGGCIGAYLSVAQASRA